MVQNDLILYVATAKQECYDKAQQSAVIQANQFFHELRKGSSLPLLVGGDDGNTYVVKLNGAGDGVLASVVEWVASKLGGLLQIPVLQPVFVNIDASFAEQAGDPETRVLLEKSVGINLGTAYLPDASSYSERYAQRLDEFLKQQIFLFDVFLLNVDRTDVNSNMIVHNGKLWCLDYSSSLAVRSSIIREPYREHVILKCLKRHPFYSQDHEPYGFIKDLKEIPDTSIREIVDSIPTEWIDNLKVGKNNAESRRTITGKLIDKKQHGIALRNRLDLLKVLKVETAEEASSRSDANRKTFEQKWGKL